jgi:hypothetical protein
MIVAIVNFPETTCQYRKMLCNNEDNVITDDASIRAVSVLRVIVQDKLYLRCKCQIDY